MKRIYIVGVGFIGMHHARAVEALSDEVQLKATDSSPEARKSFAKKFPDADLFENAEQMLDEPSRDSDILVVAPPPFVHRDIAVAGLESGRHVLCEKPLAMTRDEAADILSAARKNNRLVGAATPRHVAYAHTEAVRELVSDGELGRPYHVTFVDRTRRNRTGIEYQPESRWPLNRSKAGGGVLMNLGTYDFALLNYVLDPDRVEVNQAWTETPETDHSLPDDVTYDVEQHAGASMRYHTDAAEVAVRYERADCTHGQETSRLEIEGTEGAVRWDWKDCQGTVSLTLQYDDDNEPHEDERTFNVGGPDPQSRPLVYFDRRIRGEDAPIPVNEQAAFNLSCIRAVYEVAETRNPITTVFSNL